MGMTAKMGDEGWMIKDEKEGRVYLGSLVWRR